MHEEREKRQKGGMSMKMHWQLTVLELEMTLLIRNYYSAAVEDGYVVGDLFHIGW